MRSKAFSSGLLSLAVFFLAGGTSSAQQTYHVTDHWTIGGEGGWDYLTTDSQAHLLYVTHGTRVEVIDVLNGRPAGVLTGFKGTHGVALDPDGRFGYVSDGRGDAVVVFDRKTFATVGTIAAGSNPDGILYEPATKTVWAFNGRSNDVTVIDTANRKVVATIKVPGKPEFPQADGRGNVFVNIEDKNSIVRFDAATKTITATWRLAACESPSGMALDAAHHRLFSVCDGRKMAVVDTLSGKELASPTIGEGPDAAGYGAAHNLAFSSNGDGTLTVVDAGHGYKVLQTVVTQKGARTMSYDESRDRIYLATAEFGARPAATKENPNPRPAIVPGSFTVLVVTRR